ncbi:MAG: hypothetical protein MRZ61_05185 [Oscillospiraceae bacterium]|nr:hypothetical protein [Oscillospiraceae bacterium]
MIMNTELKIFTAVILLIFGAAHIFFPQVLWYFAHGIHDKNAEPGEHTELIYRIVGGILAVIGIIVLIGALI